MVILGTFGRFAGMGSWSVRCGFGGGLEMFLICKNVVTSLMCYRRGNIER